MNAIHVIRRSAGLALVMGIVAVGLAGCGSHGCVDGAACEPRTNLCHEGVLVCATGVCQDTGTPLADGTLCANGSVCRAGACVIPCVAYQVCQTATPCTVGSTSCTSLTSPEVCVPVSNKPDGTPCASGGDVCSAGSCLPPTCTAGAACQPPGPCQTGVTACTAPSSPGTCNVTGSKPDGTRCGPGQVCSGGQCVVAP